MLRRLAVEAAMSSTVRVSYLAVEKRHVESYAVCLAFLLLLSLVTVAAGNLLFDLLIVEDL